MKRIPFLRPALVRSESYQQYLSQIDATHIYSNFGPLNTQFEDRVLNDYFHGHGALATVNNATSGLILAISTCMRKGARYALMPSFTFAATPLSAMWCGLTPYFIDIDPQTWCMDPGQVRDIVVKLGDQVAVIVPYAAFGTYMDLTPYKELHDTGIPIVVDAAASFGTVQGMEHFGAGFPGLVVFSFHATKAFGIGEGGLVYSATEINIEHVRQASNFGFTPGRESHILGLNAKLSEYAAAIALATLDVFPRKIEVRQAVFAHYKEEFHRRGMLHDGWRLQKTAGSIAHQFVPVLCPGRFRNTDVVGKLAEASIEARTYFSPSCHQQSMFRSFPSSSLTITEERSKSIMSLPLWEDMETKHVNQVVAGVESVTKI